MNTTQNYYVLILEERTPIADLLADYFQQKDYPIGYMDISAEEMKKLSVPINNADLNLIKKESLDTTSNRIFFIEVDHVYVEIHTANGNKILRRNTLEATMKEFPNVNFIQTHRSYAVNLDAIKEWDSTGIYIGDKKIPISRRRRKEVVSIIKSKLK